MKKILVADDEDRIRRLVCDFLHNSDYETVEAVNGQEAIDKFSSDISLVVCDIMMPLLDGWEVCKKIRKISNVPIIVLTARTQEFDELLSFESGADDFVTKPFSPTVLVKRIEALLKRTEKVPVRDNAEILVADGLKMDIPAHIVVLDGNQLNLTVKEFEILKKLLGSPNRIFSRDNILDDIWEVGFEGDIRTVDSHINRLRVKLGVWGEKHLKSVFGVGYKIEVSDS